jgi:hypothetical protein
MAGSCGRTVEEWRGSAACTPRRIPMARFDTKTALVTGGGSGIGAAISRALALSDDASFISGSYHLVDGGYSAR